MDEYSTFGQRPSPPAIRQPCGGQQHGRNLGQKLAPTPRNSLSAGARRSCRTPARRALAVCAHFRPCRVPFSAVVIYRERSLNHVAGQNVEDDNKTTT